MKSLNSMQYEALRKGAEITAADDHGDKVLLMADGTYLKLFRIKRLITSARLFPYWHRFVRNAEKLSQLGIPTVKVLEVYQIPHLDRTAVHYEPLPGSTLRQVGDMDEALVDQFGRFLSDLHDKGVYLRSLHLGNVVRTPAGELGLIDIADMRIRKKPLSGRLRLRNYHHLCRYEEDREVVARHEQAFLAHVDDSIRPELQLMLQRRPAD